MTAGPVGFPVRKGRPTVADTVDEAVRRPALRWSTANAAGPELPGLQAALSPAVAGLPPRAGVSRVPRSPSTLPRSGSAALPASGRPDPAAARHRPVRRCRWPGRHTKRPPAESRPGRHRGAGRYVGCRPASFASRSGRSEVGLRLPPARQPASTARGRLRSTGATGPPARRRRPDPRPCGAAWRGAAGSPGRRAASRAQEDRSGASGRVGTV